MVCDLICRLAASQRSEYNETDVLLHAPKLQKNDRQGMLQSTPVVKSFDQGDFECSIGYEMAYVSGCFIFGLFYFISLKVFLNAFNVAVFSGLMVSNSMILAVLLSVKKSLR